MKRTSLLLALAVSLSTSTLASAALVTHGTLVADDGVDVYDWELADLISTHIPTYESMILAFTECYGGDKMDDFAGKPNTTVLSGSTPGNTTQYGGYHAALSAALTPGSTTNAAHAAGVAGAHPTGDSPTSAGPNQTIGGTNSTHILIWAGDPNAQDEQDIQNIHNNFAGHPNTTITTLSGDGTGPNADGAATKDNLIDALDDIGDVMNANEQFILFVTDHGDLDSGENAVTLTPGPNNFTLPLPALPDMINDPLNIPGLSIFSQHQIVPTEILQMQLNGQNIPSSFFDVFTEIQLDYNNDTITDMYQYHAPLWIPEGLLLPSNSLSIGAGISSSLDLISLESGAISRLPEPASFVLLAAGILGIAPRRRTAGRA